MYSNVSHLNICEVQGIMKVKLVMGPLSSQDISDQLLSHFKNKSQGLRAMWKHSSGSEQNFPGSGQTSSPEADPLILNTLFLFHVGFMKDLKPFSCLFLE